MSIKEDNRIGAEVLVRAAIKAKLIILSKGRDSLLGHFMESLGEKGELALGSTMPIQHYSPMWTTSIHE
jgi:hypothetical protein